MSTQDTNGTATNGTDNDFNKTKVEKLAKEIERTMDATHGDVESRSVRRALARFEAAKKLYHTHPHTHLIGEIVKTFYATAKFQASWKVSFDKYAPELGAAMQGSLATPSPRTRKPKDPAEVAAQAGSDVTPDTVLAADPSA